MNSRWCDVCCTSHSVGGICPGELLATTPERHGFRVNVDTPRGIEAYGVLLARSSVLWRARILTYPNVLWLVPGGSNTVKFVGATPQEAESKAIRFIRAHCARLNYPIRDEPVAAIAGRLQAEIDPTKPADEAAAVRKIRFLPVRFGVIGATEPGGTGNLSETGLFIITGLPLDRGSDLKMLLSLDDSGIALDGCVRWMQRKPRVGRSPGMGVQLSSPPARYVEYVRAMA